MTRGIESQPYLQKKMGEITMLHFSQELQEKYLGKRVNLEAGTILGITKIFLDEDQKGGSCFGLSGWALSCLVNASDVELLDRGEGGNQFDYHPRFSRGLITEDTKSDEDDIRLVIARTMVLWDGKEKKDPAKKIRDWLTRVIRMGDPEDGLAPIMSLGDIVGFLESLGRFEGEFVDQLFCDGLTHLITKARWYGNPISVRKEEVAREKIVIVHSLKQKGLIHYEPRINQAIKLLLSREGMGQVAERLLKTIKNRWSENETKRLDHVADLLVRKVLFNRMNLMLTLDLADRFI